MIKLAIVGIFFDGYYDIWEDFLELFEKNWKNCPYPLYIVNNEKEIKFNKKYNATVLHAGKEAEYSRKVQKAIAEIDADYYLLLLEDFFIGKELNKEILEEIMNKIEKENLKYYRMPLNEFIHKKNGISNITPNQEYTLSCQPSIWKKEFLKECIGSENYNAWIFEGIYTKSKKAHTYKFLEGCINDNRNVLCLYHGALQGKILNSTYEYFKEKGYIFKNKREILNPEIEKRHRKKVILKNICPFFLQKFIKYFIKTNSIIEKYKKEIDSLIIKMKLN